MATANDIIKRALRTIGVLATGENPSSEMANDALAALNDVLAGLSNENLTIYAERVDSIAMDGSTYYTIGLTGDLNAVRPTSILCAHYTATDGTSYPLRMITPGEYCDIADKDATGDIPDIVWFSMQYPLALAYVYPLPSTGTLNFLSRVAITAFTALTDSVSLPPGYERMLRYALAVELMPEYGISNPQVFQMYIDSKADIKRTNTRPALLKVSLPFGCAGGDDIRMG